MLPRRCRFRHLPIPGTKQTPVKTYTHQPSMQRWIYRIDTKRVNEYGQVAEPTPEEKEAIPGESRKDR